MTGRMRQHEIASWTLAACLLVPSVSSCSAPGPAPASRTAEAGADAPTTPPASVEAPQAASTDPACAKPPCPASPEPPPERFPNTSFPPEDLEPPHERSKKDGDGTWQPLGDASTGDRAADHPVMVHTVLHPHPISKFASLTVVAIDLARVDLHLVAGLKEPVADHVPEDERTGLVAPAHLDRTLAILNGGYKTNHGRWGVMVGEHEFVPARDEGCTVAIFGDGGVRVASWPALSDQRANMAAFRQTPPCLLEGGEVHPRLINRDEKPWGGRDPKRKTRRRSAVGIDATGRTLFYGFGVETGPKLMAEGLRHAGAVGAAQLDINWSWTRFLLVGRKTPAADLEITSTLVPKMNHSRKGYLSKPAERDFFYLTLRPEPSP